MASKVPPGEDSVEHDRSLCSQNTATDKKFPNISVIPKVPVCKEPLFPLCLRYNELTGNPFYLCQGQTITLQILILCLLKYVGIALLIPTEQYEQSAC